MFADSTCVAEYMAAADAAKMAIHMRLMLDDFGIQQTNPTTIMEDNMSSCKIAEAKALRTQTHASYRFPSAPTTYCESTTRTAKLLCNT
jgi:hypothetical protein